MVELAIKKVGNKVIFYNFNAEIITLDTKFKTVLCSNLFYYIKNRPKALKAWAELLSDKGKLILIEECPFVPAESEEMNPHRKKLMSVIDPLSLEQTIKILTDSGFTLEKQVSTPIDKKHNLYGLIFEIKIDTGL